MLSTSDLAIFVAPSCQHQNYRLSEFAIYLHLTQILTSDLTLAIGDLRHIMSSSQFVNIRYHHYQISPLKKQRSQSTDQIFALFSLEHHIYLFFIGHWSLYFTNIRSHHQHQFLPSASGIASSSAEHVKHPHAHIHLIVIIECFRHLCRSEIKRIYPEDRVKTPSFSLSKSPLYVFFKYQHLFINIYYHLQNWIDPVSQLY